MIGRYWKHLLGIIGGCVLLFFLYMKYCEVNTSEIVFTVTAVIIYWYTLETHEMRKEMVDQKNISVMPIFYIREVVDSGGSRHALLLENCGNFPAFNVKIQDITIEAKLKNAVSTLKFVFHEFEVVPKGEKIPIVFDILKDQKESNEEGKEIFEPELFEGFAVYDFDVPMTYENILGYTYRVILKMGKGGSTMGRPERII